MHRGANAVHSALSAIDWVARGIVVAALIGEIGVVLTDISIRSLFTLSLLWSDEASKLCLVTLAFIGGAVSYRARHHTAIQFVTRFLPEGLRAAVAAARVDRPEAAAAILAVGGQGLPHRLASAVQRGPAAGGLLGIDDLAAVEGDRSTVIGHQRIARARADPRLVHLPIRRLDRETSAVRFPNPGRRAGRRTARPCS